ncbi:ClbS/DfsB family four-helix bundle protein [Pragia fontium]|uniref:ClbS/DfsB family four-helix bundle protein n=1 Tax=Pragia fontium DSM 5563 = ATCC 49100 TaxID=1122977 RepID=A0AAJ5BHM8_9GAMM|nr:ClbS/DfsB family four-helix bundle protein [Pragia fontium]AKJ42866.1 hypothetical protein QQ39_12940 [Pragia fontium]SFD03827.1 hypothetical protein SAMN02745723_10727 [Pragia fontium DSM 5563 = ATCC 49100]SUB83259.1 Uncharacterized conserved protein [Pragia fontium]VEJ56154.1 Uncharacterized conserved protein [Pragia fontium]
MPRPTNKQQLLSLSDENYFKIVVLIDSLPESVLEMVFPFEDRDRNIRDVMVHLYEWHLMMLRWYGEGMAGKKPIMPAEGYTWRTTPELNQAIWQKYQAMSLETARLKLNASHRELQSLIMSHNDQQLFTKKYYPWTGSASLGSYFISATSSHYDWALKKLKRFQKSF